MFFEPDEFELKLKKTLTEELDAENIFVSEDLIQRTLAAVKESDLINDTKENIDTNQLEESDTLKNFKESSNLIDIEKKKQKHKKMWMRSFSGIAAAALLVFVGMKMMDGTLNLGGAKKESTSRADRSELKVKMALEDTTTTEESMQEGAGVKESAVVEESAEQDMVTSESNSITSNQDVLTGEDASTAGELNNTYGIRADGEEEKQEKSIDLGKELLLQEQEADVYKDSAYISINYKQNEETMSEWNDFVNSLELTEKETGEEDTWLYKIYVQESEEYVTSYFFGKSGELEMTDYDVNGPISTVNYELNDVEAVISKLEIFRTE